MQTLAGKAGDMPIVAPVHPYVERAIKSLGLDMPRLHILPPQSYLHFGFLINQAKGIVTDSGNIAEEATFLDVPCITLNTYAEHPMTHTPIVGFEVPFFEEAKAMCLQAAQKVPQMRFVAWDVAVTEKGPVFIEGNSFPSHAVPQFAAHYPDGIGIMREFREFIDI